MQVCCPTCATRFPIESGFAEDDGKRLAAILAGMEPVAGRATLVYLRLFKPPKTELRLARAVAIARELADLVEAGTVCRDERTGVRRPATAAMWAAGIERMMETRDKLVLPLTGHGYLREVVFGLADRADAEAEREREKAARDGRGTGREAPPPVPQSRADDKLQQQIDFYRNLARLDKMSPVEADQRIAALRTGRPVQ